MAKIHTQEYNRLERVLAIAGLAVIFLAVITTLFGAWNNRRFILEPLDIIYYYRYLVLLGSGFIIGYVLLHLKKPKMHLNSSIFISIVYGLLAFIIFNLLDVLRVIWVNPITALPYAYPWGKIFFLGSPIIALLILFVVALIVTRKTSATNRILSWIVFLAFIAQQASLVIFAMANASHAVSVYDSLWVMLLSIITTPLFIAAISYALLGNVKDILDRAFYSSIIGTICAVVSIVVWEFRTNPEANATEVFGIIVTICTFASMAILVWFARRAVR